MGHKLYIVNNTDIFCTKCSALANREILLMVNTVKAMLLFIWRRTKQENSIKGTFFSDHFLAIFNKKSQQNLMRFHKHKCNYWTEMNVGEREKNVSTFLKFWIHFSKQFTKQVYSKIDQITLSNTRICHFQNTKSERPHETPKYCRWQRETLYLFSMLKISEFNETFAVHGVETWIYETCQIKIGACLMWNAQILIE